MVEPYYVLSKAWGAVSLSPFWLRLLSAIAVACAAVVLFRFVSSVWSQAAGLVSAFSLAVLPSATRYGQDARAYALTVLGATIVVASWWDAAATGRRRSQATLAVALAVTVAMQAYTLLIVPVVLAASLLAPIGGDRWRELRRVAPSIALGLVAVAPYLSLFSNATGQPNPPSVSPRNIAEEVLRLPVALLSAPLAVEFSLLLLIAVTAGVLVALQRDDVRRRLAVTCACWLVLPIALATVAQAAIGVPGLVARYWMFTIPALAVGVSLALDAFPAPVGGKIAAVAAIGALAIPTHAAVRGIDGHIGQRWQVMRAAIRIPGLSRAPVLVRQAYPARSLYAVDSSAATRLPLTYYPPGRGWVNPGQRWPHSVEYQTRVAPAPAVIAFWAREGSRNTMPTVATFDHYKAFVGPFRPLVFCNFFGDALAVYVPRTGTIMMPANIANELQALDPDRIRCRTRR